MNIVKSRKEYDDFLFHMDGEGARNTIQQKNHSGTVLKDDDQMKLVVLSLTIPGSEGKQGMLEKFVELVEQITDEKQRIFTLSGVTVYYSADFKDEEK